VIELSKRLIELMARPEDRAYYSRFIGGQAPESFSTWNAPPPPSQEEPALGRKPRWEKEEHAIFSSWLRLNKLPFDHSRTDRRTTNEVGLADFIVLVNGHLLCIEFKLEGEKLRPEQEAQASLWTSQGAEFHVFSLALQAIRLVNERRGAG
jgi:hypothetical protein